MTIRKNDSGFSLLELLIAISIISITLLAIGALGSITANGLALTQRKRDAESTAVEAINKLKANRRSTLPAGGAFAVDATSGVPTRNEQAEVILACSVQYCDRIITLPPAREGDAPRQEVLGWEDPIPDSATVKFIRAWTLTDEDAARNWRRITVAVFPNNVLIPTTFSVTGAVIR